MRSHRPYLPLIAAAALALVGCSAPASDNGSGENTAAQASSPIPDTSAIIESVQTDPALAAKVPSAISADGALTVGSYFNFAPSMFLASDGKTVIGNDNDILQSIAKKLGLKVQYENMDFAALITSLQSGRVEATMAAMNDTAERQQAIDFVDYLMSGIALIVQKGNPHGVNGPDDLCGKVVATTTGTSNQMFAEGQSKKCVESGQQPIEMSVTDNDSTNQNNLRTGRIDVLLQDMPTAVYLAKTVDDGEAFEVVDTDLIDGAPYGIGINKANPQLRDAIAAALNSVIEDGTYTKILDAWGTQHGAVQQATVNGGS